MTDTIKTIDELAQEVGEVYFIQKDAKSELESLRKDFFVMAATVASLEGSLAQKTVVVPDTITDYDKAKAHVELYNTGWKIVDCPMEQPAAPYRFLIEEDPDLLPCQVVVPIDGGVIDIKGKEHPGYVVTKTIVSGSATLDDDRLREEDPELLESITEYQNWETLREIGVTEEQLAAVAYPRVIKHPDHWDAWEEAALTPYTYESARSARLNVRFAKEDEC